MITFEEATFIQRIEIVLVSSGLALLVMTALWMRARRKRRDPVGCILPLVFVTACMPLLSLVVAKVRLLPYELEYDALIARSFDHEGLRAVAPGVSPLRSESGAIRAAALQSSLLSTIEVLTDDHRPDAELREWLLSDFRSGREPTNGRAATAMLLAACGVLPEDDALVEAAWAALPVDAWISVDDGSLQLAASIPWSWWQARPCSGSESASSAVDVKLVRLVAKDGREVEVVPFDGRDRRSKSGTAAWRDLGLPGVQVASDRDRIVIGEIASSEIRAHEQPASGGDAAARVAGRLVAEDLVAECVVTMQRFDPSQSGAGRARDARGDSVPSATLSRAFKVPVGRR